MWLHNLVVTTIVFGALHRVFVKFLPLSSALRDVLPSHLGELRAKVSVAVLDSGNAHLTQKELADAFGENDGDDFADSIPEGYHYVYEVRARRADTLVV